jgi:HD-GYP domain-containing protein (c-di-GMP phosphodiesterase class II)
MSVLAHHRHEQPVHRTRECLGLLLKVLNERDPGVLEDLNRMGHLASDTGRALGLDEREIERVELAARLHDVGKLAIPDAILQKPAALDAEEWEVMRTHPEIGARIAASAPSLAHIADLIRSHHERHDGTGYPDGLEGEEIPVPATIIAVCAAFVAMMRHRPYSDAITVEEAMAELRRCAGSQFHPAVVAAFCGTFEASARL